MTVATAETKTIRSFGFNIPCRRFLIRAIVARDRRLSVVDEFVLRALKLCEDVPVRRLATYLGFTAAETETVMADLASSGLVTVEGDSARLHPSAHEHFRGSEDGTPCVVEVDSWVVRLWFDLVSKNMAAPDRIRSARNLIDIRPSGMARDLPASYAKKAFEDSFGEYLRKVRRISNPDRFVLYSVSEFDRRTIRLAGVPDGGGPRIRSGTALAAESGGDGGRGHGEIQAADDRDARRLPGPQLDGVPPPPRSPISPS